LQSVLLLAVSQFADMDFLTEALVPLSVLMALAWVLYVLARSLGKGTDTSPLVSGLGPEGIMLHRATQRAWGHDAQGEAGKHFAAGEAHFQAGRYLEAAEAFRSSVECQESLAADLNLGAVLLNIADWGR
jgi:hypothetical protein